MTVSMGSRLGPYEILSPIGAGGMGEVYRARDTKLGRDVAIKVLPDAFARDSARMARFGREAKLLAALDHPNVASIYGLEDSGSTRALVMQLAEGPTLADRIRQWPIPIEDALQIARQIADALEYAHEKGIIHRDLKPANVKVAPDDTVKILDFGLAKALETEPSAAELANSPTISRMATQTGVLLGTAAYMSPEQAKAKPVDRRADIWAFGCVLYEMLTGKMAFHGDTVTDTLAAVIRAEPDWSRLPIETPMRVRVLLQRCLQKDPKQRLRDIGVARISLDEVLSGSPEAAPLPGADVPVWRRVIPWVSAGALVGLLTAILFGSLYRSHGPEKARVVRSYVKANPNSRFLSSTSPTSGFALSPDGLRLAYVAESADGRAMLWVRPLNSLEAQPLAGTQDATSPFWSPDSRNIGFFADGKLKTVEASGGPPLTLCDAPNPRGGTWSQGGVILFAPNMNAPLYQVPASGGTATPVTSLEPSKGEISHRWPQFLPDGRHFLYLSGAPYALGQYSPSKDLLVGSLDSKERKLLMHGEASATYASGYILFLRQNTLMAQPFDTKRLELIGDAYPIADPVQQEEIQLRSIFSASQNGILAYSEGAGNDERELVWVDRGGNKVGEVPGADEYRNPRISPDGKRVLYTVTSPSGYDIWSYELARGVKTRLTFGSGPGQANVDAVWPPDGQRIAYTSTRGGKYAIFQKSVNGSGGEQVLLDGADSVQFPVDWSPDDKFLLFQRLSLGAVVVYMLPFTEERKPRPVLQSQFTFVRSALSPDGKWLAYCSNESGDLNLYVVALSGQGGKWQVSSGGGDYPRWRRDGKEQFYLSLEKKMMSLDVKASGSSFAIGKVRPLFETRAYRSVVGAYDVTSDGQRFVIAYEPEQPNAAITLVENWDAEIRKQ